MKFIDELVKASGNEYANIVADGVDAGDVDSFVDSGSYIFNAFFSGSLYGGHLQTRLLQSQVSQQQVKLSSH